MGNDEILVYQLTFSSFLKAETNERQKSFLLLKAAIQKSSGILLAKSLSNYSIQLRQDGRLTEAKEYMDRAWNTTIIYLKAQQELGMSNYLDLALRATGLEGDRVQRGFREANTNNPNSPRELSQGPPIVVWVLELMNNMGLLSLSRGKYDTALKCFSIVKRLVDNVLEEYPPPDPVLNACLEASNSAMLGKGNARNSMSGRSGTPLSRTNSSVSTSTDLKRSNTLLSKSSEGGTKKFQLSYLHRHTIMAQVKSLTHMGAIHLRQGHSQLSLNHQTAAHSLLSAICDLSPTFNIIPPRNLHTPTPHSQTEPQFGLEVLKLKSVISTNLGLSYLKHPDLPTSISYLRKSLQIETHILEILTPKSQIKLVNGRYTRLMTKLASLHFRFASLAKVFKGGDETLEYSIVELYVQLYRHRILGDGNGQAECLVNLFVGYTLMGRCDVARVYLEKAIKMGCEVLREELYLGLTQGQADLTGFEGFLRRDIPGVKGGDSLSSYTAISSYFRGKPKHEGWVYRIEMKITKLLWLRGEFQASLRNLQKSTSALLNMDVILPATSLILAAEHFETGSEGLVKSLSVHHYRLLSHLVSQMQQFGLVGPEGLHIPPGNLGQVQKGLDECAEYLVLLELDVCESCKGLIEDGSLLFNNQIGGCVHGFGINLV